MTKIMDRVFDLQAVDWGITPVSLLDQWEHEALQHVKECRCHKCAVFFARLDPCDRPLPSACAIKEEVIVSLRSILARLHKL